MGTTDSLGKSLHGMELMVLGMHEMANEVHTARIEQMKLEEELNNWKTEASRLKTENELLIKRLSLFIKQYAEPCCYCNECLNRELKTADDEWNCFSFNINVLYNKPLSKE